MNKIIEKRIIELCIERKKNKCYNIYPAISEIILKESGERYDSQRLRDICRTYRKKHNLDDNFNVIQCNKSEDKIVHFPTDYKETTEIHSDGKQTSDKLIEMSEKQSKDTNYVLKAHGYDIKDWEPVNAKSSMWNSFSNQEGVQVLYSSKITVKPRTNTISLEEISEHFEKFKSKYTKKIIRNTVNSNKMFEVPVMDLHLGKLGWHGETGEDYDHKIAEKRFLGVITNFIDRTKNIQFEEIIFPIGQDFFNFSTIDGATINGTRQDNDLRWQKLFLLGAELLVNAIDLLSEIAPTRVFYVSGNHDKTTSYYILNYLYAWFRNNENISVDRSPLTRKYVHFGNCLIGFAHGDTEKQRIKGIMQVEAPVAWGNSKFREWHLGHLHSEQIREENGVIIRNISSITGTDAWHYETGYVGSIKKAQGFIWDREFGLTDILNSVIV